MLNPNVRPLDLQWCVYCRHVESESAWDCFKLLTYFCITMWLNIISSSQDSSNVLLKSLFRTFIMSYFSFYSWQWIVGKRTLWKSTWGPLWTGWIVGLKRLPANAPTKSASRQLRTFGFSPDVQSDITCEGQRCGAICLSDETTTVCTCMHATMCMNTK